MIARWGRKVGPWATPVLVVVEIVLVWSGLLQLGTAVLVGIAIEAVLWVTAVGRAIVAVRRFRAGRAAGDDVWASMEAGLAALIPRRAAHVLLIEPQLWVSLARWVTGRHDGTRCTCTFRYDAALRVVLWAGLALVIVEGAVVEFVLALVVHGTVWLIVSMAVHLYAVLGLLGVLASFATRPHVLVRDLLRVRDGVFSEVLVPLAAITGVRRVSRANFGRSGLKIDQNGEGALLAHGDANIELALDPARPVTFRPAPRRGSYPIGTLTITVDGPDEFIRQVNANRQAATGSSPLAALTTPNTTGEPPKAVSFGERSPDSTRGVSHDVRTSRDAIC